MGCAQSRDELRKGALGADFNLVPYAFKGVDNTTLADFHPFDKWVISYLGEGKELADAPFGAKFEKEDYIKAQAKTLFDSLKAFHGWAATGFEDKEKSAFSKYSSKQVQEAVADVCKTIAEVYPDNKWEEAAKQEGETAPPKKDGEEGTGEAGANEGGEAYEGGDPPVEGAPAVAEAKSSEFPAKLFGAYVKNEFFADFVKSNVASGEIVPGFNALGGGLSFLNPMGFIPAGCPVVDTKFAAAVIFFHVYNNSDKEEDVTFASHYTEDDKAELMEAAASEGKRSLIFPGVIAVNDGTAPAATDKATHKFTFKVKAKVHEHDGKKYIARLIATVSGDKECKDGNVELTENAGLKYADVKAYAEAVAKGAA